MTTLRTLLHVYCTVILGFRITVGIVVHIFVGMGGLVGIIVKIRNT